MRNHFSTSTFPPDTTKKSHSLNRRGRAMLHTLLVIILILILIGALPNWGYSRAWGYGPSGLVGTILIIVVILALLGRV
jgi:Protein of unknown function (DUF3309)